MVVFVWIVPLGYNCNPYYKPVKSYIRGSTQASHTDMVCFLIYTDYKPPVIGLLKVV